MLDDNVEDIKSYYYHYHYYLNYLLTANPGHTVNSHSQASQGLSFVVAISRTPHTDDSLSIVMIVSARIEALFTQSTPAYDPPSDGPSSPQQPDALLVLLPLLIVLSTFLFLLLTFLICVLLIRRRRGIILGDNDGPVDMSREELIEGEGGFEGVESRWLEGATDTVRRAYLRAKGLYLNIHLHLTSHLILLCRISAPIST